MAIATDEIFGPVLVAIPFHDEAEAIRIANDTHYGLGASVQTNDIKRAIRVARAVRAGLVRRQRLHRHAETPPSAASSSRAMGREGGAESIAEFLETKTVDVALTDAGF